MAYPIWITPAGDLGKISELEFYQFLLEAYTNTQQNITFSLVAGRLPSGIVLDTNGAIVGQPATEYINIAGVPAAVNQDRDFKFTIRAQVVNNPTLVTDRTFSLTITGNKPPIILTTSESLGSYLDGTAISVQLEAVDLDNENITWKLIEGELPIGVAFSSSGLISGVIKPYVQLPEGADAGWDNQRWESYPWEFSTRSTNKSYNFTVEVTDGKEVDVRQYRITVYSYNSIRADNTVLTADDTVILSADLNDKRPPVLLTTDLGNYAVYKSDNYFAFKFDAIDLDGDAISYSISAGGELGFDAIGSTFDTNLFDKGSFSLPSGLVLQANTGWLIGYLPSQIEPTKDYTFSLQVYKTNFPQYITPPKVFTVRILGSLDTSITWLSPNNLGFIYAGDISKFGISAVSNTNSNLTYSLKNNSRLPQGLQLLSDGLLSGRCSFQSFSVDSSDTTFDRNLLSDGETTFDRTFRFTVIVTNADAQISAERTFELSVRTKTQEPYENVYIKCLPEEVARDKYFSIIENTDIFSNDLLYRGNDPYFGKNREIYLLAAYGIKASAAEDYIAAMENRHYNKKFYFGDYGTSLARDENDNVIYEVIWVDIIEDTRAYLKGRKQSQPAASTNLTTKISNWQNPNFAPNDPVGYTLKINDSHWLRRDLTDNLEIIDPSALPEWMISVQKDKTVLGFTTKAVLAYVKPGEGEKILFRLNRASRAGLIPDIKEVPFVADRYILDNNLSQYFNIESGQWANHSYTTFDSLVDPNNTVNVVETIDFALEIPFEFINGKTVADIEAMGGIDGIVTSYSGKKIIFAKQENFFDYAVDTSNQGWIRYNQFFDDLQGFDEKDFDEADIIPGYLEKQNNPLLENQRSGIWEITIDENELIKLEFVSEISLTDSVLVRFGTKYGGNYIQYTANGLNDLATVPAYLIIDTSSLPQPLPTTFDNNSTRFVNNIDIYTAPFEGDKYLKFPKIGVFS